MATHTNNVEGLVAQRRALVDYLRALPSDAWTDEVRAVVRHLADRYADALAGADVEVPDAGDPGDPGHQVDQLEQCAEALERHFAEVAEDRWHLSREEFGRVEGTSGMDMASVLLDLHRHAHQLGELVGRPVPVPDEARRATAAALAWLAGGKVEAPVQVVLEDGDDYVIGSGPPEAVLRTDHDALVAVATGEARPDELVAAGRWSFEGPDEARRAFEESLRVDPED
jgi:hypothetical protein